MVDLQLLGIGDGSVERVAAARLSSHRHEMIHADSVSRREAESIGTRQDRGALEGTDETLLARVESSRRSLPSEGRRARR
jgi:hypothetical protein